jgi:hypothetical protein
MLGISAIVVSLGVALFALLALLGDTQFAGQERLPVRWGNKNRPHLYAPRRLGLGILPVIGILLLLALWFAEQPVYILAAAVLAIAALNLLYFRAIGRFLEAA